MGRAAGEPLAPAARTFAVSSRAMLRSVRWSDSL